MPGDARPVAPIEGPIDAVVSVPGSKSLTNRALVCAALAEGASTITGALVADDVDAMADCLRLLGATIDTHGTTLGVGGTAGRLVSAAGLDARRSGTTARFLLPVLAAGGGRYRLDGSASLRARPMAALLEAVRALGAAVVEQGVPGHLPVVVSGPIAGGRVEVAGDITSQFVSGLLLAGPVVAGGIEVVPTTPLVSAPYIDMTAAVMRRFGAAIDGLHVAPGGYQATEYAVEPDASAASYFFAAPAIVGGRVRVDGLGAGSLQGDLAFVDVLARMGADVERTAGTTTVSGAGRLRGIEVDLRDLPDMAQTVAAVAAFADGPTTVSGVGFIRGHETDRIAAVVAELRRCGIEAYETADGFVVHGGVATPTSTRIETYDDHRMAMSFALLGLRVTGIEIADPGCVAKTFPGFWDALESLRSGSRSR